MGEEDTRLLDAVFKSAISDTPYPYQRKLIATRSRFVVVNKSRRTGISTAIAYKALLYALAGKTSLLTSPSERQSYNLMSMIDAFLRAIPMGFLPTLIEDSKSIKRFKSGGTIHSLPNSASQIRGFQGDFVVMDEAAHFLNGTDEEVYEAILPSITLGGSLMIVSTPFGDKNLFYRRWTEKNDYEKILVNWHECPTLASNISSVRKEYDEISFDQEFDNTFRGEVASEFPRALVEKCVDPDLEYELNPTGDVAGFDVGRRRDLSAVIVIRREGDHRKVIGKAVWQGIPFEEQQNRALEIAKSVGTFRIDQGGMGEAPSEWLKARSPNVYPILFNDQNKTEMFLNLKRLFEQDLIRIPLDVRLMQSLGMIRRYYRLGRVIIDAERTDELGHADEATALALACYEPRTYETSAAGIWEDPCPQCMGKGCIYCDNKGTILHVFER